MNIQQSLKESSESHWRTDRCSGKNRSTLTCSREYQVSTIVKVHVLHHTISVVGVLDFS